MSTHTRPALALSVVTLLALAGCHSGGRSASPATTARSSASSASTANASTVSTATATGNASNASNPSNPSTDAAAGPPVDVCAVMPLAMAKALTGEPFIRAYTETETVPVTNYSCDYQEAGSNLPVATLIVIPGKGASWYNGPASDPSSKPYAGLGDKSVYNPDPIVDTKVTLDALYGTTDFEFDDFKDANITNDKAAAVIRAAATKMKLSS